MALIESPKYEFIVEVFFIFVHIVQKNCYGYFFLKKISHKNLKEKLSNVYMRT